MNENQISLHAHVVSYYQTKFDMSADPLPELAPRTYEKNNEKITWLHTGIKTLFRIVGVIDCRSGIDPEGFNKKNLKKIFNACSHYCGSTRGKTNIVNAHLCFIFDSHANPALIKQLRKLHFGNVFTKAILNISVLIDQEKTCTSYSFGGFLNRPPRRLLTEPRVLYQAKVDTRPEYTPHTRTCWTTLGIATLLTLIFGLQALSAHSFFPSLRELFVFGALIGEQIQAGEWFRLVTGAQLHADIFHLLLNLLALVWGGILLERMVGGTWLLFIYLLSTLGGAVSSYAFHDPLTVSVGASGAIMGILAATNIFQMHYRRTPKIIALEYQLTGLIVTALIPANARDASTIDYACHFGGAVVGGLVGLYHLRYATVPVRATPKVIALTIVLIIGLLVAEYEWLQSVAFSKEEFFNTWFGIIKKSVES